MDKKVTVYNQDNKIVGKVKEVKVGQFREIGLGLYKENDEIGMLVGNKEVVLNYSLLNDTVLINELKECGYVIGNENIDDKIQDYFNEQVSNIDVVTIHDKYYLSSYSNDDLEQFIQFLEKNHYSLDEFKKNDNIEDTIYNEQWTICDDCGSKIWYEEYERQEFILNESGLYCKDCILDHSDDILDYYCNENHKAINTTLDLKEFIKKNKLHKVSNKDFTWNDNNDPEIESKKILDKLKHDYNFVWIITHEEMFGISANLYIYKEV